MLSLCKVESPVGSSGLRLCSRVVSVCIVHTKHPRMEANLGAHIVGNRSACLVCECIVNGIWQGNAPRNALVYINICVIRSKDNQLNSIEYHLQHTCATGITVIDFLQVVLFIPRKSTEIKAQVAKFQMFKDSDLLTERLFIRKVIKGFEEQESVLVDNSYRI